MTKCRPRPLTPLLAAALLAGCGEARMGSFDGPPLNPNLYRAQIVRIDAIVFEDQPLGSPEREEVANTLRVLGELAGKDTANTLRRAHGRELRTLAELAKRTKIGTPLAGSMLHRQWFRIRASLFDDAWWFRRSAADPVEPVEPAPAAPSPLRPPTPEERAGLDQTLFSLGALLDRAKSDLPNEYESEAHREFVLDAQRELSLDSLRLGPKPPTYGIDVLYQDAHRYAAEALRNFDMLVGLGTGAPRSSREYLIGKAEENLGRAREAVTHLPR